MAIMNVAKDGPAPKTSFRRINGKLSQLLQERDTT